MIERSKSVLRNGERNSVECFKDRDVRYREMTGLLVYLYERIRYGTCRRIREIMSEAPWSNHDLFVSLTLIAIGTGLYIYPEVFTELRALAYLNKLASLSVWVTFFLFSGFVNLAVVLWCETPPFTIRLLVRMLGAFCFLIMAFSGLMFSVLIPSTIVYSMIAIWSIWGILRTQASGR